MQPEITLKLYWYEVDGDFGTEYFESSFVTAKEARENYFGNDVYSVERIKGHGARLSMPGYMDCTEWSVFDTAEEAAEYLLEMYYDYPDDELTTGQQTEREWLESLAK